MYSPPFLSRSRFQSVVTPAVSFGLIVFGLFAVFVPTTLLAQSVAYVSVGSRVCSCGWLEDSWQPGLMNNRGKFLVSEKEVSRLRKRIRGRSLTTAQTKKIKKSIRRHRNEMNSCYLPCQELPPSGPTPCTNATPGSCGTGTPTPTPTPSGEEGCYNESGDTNCFGIPDGLTGNVDRGMQLFIDIGCQGCHSSTADGGRRDWTFQRYTNAPNIVPEMVAVPLVCNQQCFADITAYLNRYNPNQ